MRSVHKERTPAPYKTSTGIPRICIPTLPRYVSTSAFGRTVSLADGRRHWLMPRHRLWVFGLRISVLPRPLRGTVSLPTGWPGTRALCLRSTLTPNRRRRFGSPWQSFAYCIWVSCAASKHVSRWSSFCGDPQPQLTKEGLLRTHKTTPHPASQPHSTPASQHKTTPHGDAVTTTGRSRETESCSSAVENGNRPASRRPHRAVQQRPVRICPTATAIQLTRSQAVARTMAKAA